VVTFRGVNGDKGPDVMVDGGKMSPESSRLLTEWLKAYSGQTAGFTARDVRLV
jgi:hypothetical protein